MTALERARDESDTFTLDGVPIRSDGWALEDAMFPRFDVACPKCRATPFRPFMRGMVARSYRFSDLWRWILRKPAIPSSCLICWDCKEIVGYE
mgnify:CR=1 FL=1